MNTQYLMRQEIRLHSEKLKVINIILSLSLSLLRQGYSSNKLPSCIQDIDNMHNLFQISYSTDYVLVCLWESNWSK